MAANSSEALAYGSLLQHARGAELAKIARAFFSMALKERDLSIAMEGVARLASQAGMSREEATTPFGNALDVLAGGPKSTPERALANALAAHAFAFDAPTDPDAQARASAEMVWLAAHTAFDGTGLLDLAGGAAALPLWDAVASRIREADREGFAKVGRGETFVAALALASSPAAEAAKRASKLANEVFDPTLARVLHGSARVGHAVSPLVGEVTQPPRGPFRTALFAMTGILLAIWVARLTARVALAYKTPAEVVVSHDGGVRIRWRVEVLGRTVREYDVVVPRAGLLRVMREERYARTGLYAGLFALTLGSYFGVHASIDGIRAASPSLLGFGLAVIALGLALDFALASASLGARRRCRVLFIRRDGTALCIGGVDTQRADALVNRLERP